MKKLYEALFISDVHMPTHNKDMVGPGGKLFSLLKRKKYKKIFQIGDLVCFDDFSFHEAPADRTDDTVFTLDLVHEFYTNLRKVAPTAEIFQIAGNHEVRLERYIKRNAPRLQQFKSLTVQEMFKLDEFKIKWKGIRDRLVVDGLKVTHGTRVRPESGGSARAELKANHYKTGVSGHCHRLGWVKDNDVVWMELGNLADPNYEAHAYLGDSEANWHQGFGEGTCCVDANGNYHWFLRPIEILNNSFVVDGILY